MTAGEQYEMVRAAVRRSCIHCFGTGEITQNYPPMGHTADWRVVPCPECGGRKVIAALEEMRKDMDEAIRTRTLAQEEAVELQLTVRTFRDEKWCFNPEHTENKEQ